MKKIVLLMIFSMLFIGCGTKVVEVPKYIYNKAPLLELKDTKTTYEFGKLYNKNGKVCVKRWDACLKKKDFIELVDYLQALGATIDKSNAQVIEYNKWAEEQNSK